MKYSYIKSTKNAYGEITKYTLKNIENNKIIDLPTDEVLDLLKNGTIIDGLSLDRYKKIKISKSKTKSNFSTKATKIKNLQKKIEMLEKEHQNSKTRDELIRAKRKLLELQGYDTSNANNMWTSNFKVYGQDNKHAKKL